MYKYLAILLSLTSVLSYGQKKYTVRNTYQYEGDDSTNAKLVLTEKYNANGKIIHAKYDYYTNTFEENNNYYDVGENYYYYRDTFLIKQLEVHKAVRWDLTGRKRLNSYINGDSSLFYYDYDIDKLGRIKSIKITSSEKVSYNMMCGNEAELFDDTLSLRDTLLRSMKQQLVDMHNKMEDSKQWSIPTVQSTSYEYDEHGLATETTNQGVALGQKYIYDYEYNTNKLISKTAYIKSEKNNEFIYAATYLYKYYPDHSTVYRIGNWMLKKAVPDDKGILSVPSTVRTSYYNLKKLLTRVIIADGYDNSIHTIYFYYDKYDRLTKDVTQYFEHSKITHRYTYE
ncbi:MAG: hypothetical protein JST82_05850 [Bacteroidetes bacterium]|nr:hypothetical protein [Bacteroidota bacterium]